MIVIMKQSRAEHYQSGTALILCGVTVVLVALNDLVFSAKNSILLLATSLCISFLLVLNKEKYNKIFTFLSVGILLLFTLHFLSNAFSIYDTFTLPQWFYSFKIYRLVSLHSTTLVGFLMLVVAVTTKEMISFDLKIWLVYPIIVYYLLLSGALVYTNVIQSIQNISVPYADRMEFKLGGRVYVGWIWPFSKFIVENTPSSARIAIPPQSNVWKMEGNVGYFRWFVYPRILVNSIDSFIIPSDVEYILISVGECHEGACIWPKQEISQSSIEKMLIIDRETSEVQTLTDEAYIPGKYDWGIIKLKR